MKKTTFLLFFTISVFSQNEELKDSIFFSQMIAMHHTEFQKKSTYDYHRGNYEASEEYFNTLVDLKLKGTLVDDFKVNSIDGKIYSIYELKRPMYLMSYASWCVPSNGELEALGMIVNENSSWMDFVLILWDNKKEALEFSNQFHPDIIVLYVNELYNNETKTIKMLKHSLGVPVSLTISDDKTILNIRKNTQIHPSVDTDVATKACYEDIHKDIKLLQEYENL